ncbi:hypothetical protein RUND412_005111 [Rhizina undulata]
MYTATNAASNPSSGTNGSSSTTATTTTTSSSNPPPSSNSQQQQLPRPTSGRRNVPATQPLSGQLPPLQNGNSTNVMPTPIPPQQQPHGQPPGIPMGPGVPFDASRSPPGSKNLNHVPCKFFRQGACQAGKACPFSHSNDPASDQAPCKYFSKGNCKFGPKCALAHVLPDGRRINRPNFNGGIQFGRMEASFTNHRSALHNSLMQANMLSHHTPNHSFGNQDDFPVLPAQSAGNGEHSLSSSLPDSRYGSPRDIEPLTMSPLASSQRTLGPLDATLPASFDRHDYSVYAKHGPYAASVPNKFGIDSPPPSLPSNTRTGGALQSLYASAFGDEESGSLGELSRSPRFGEESFGNRILHSSLSSRWPKPQLLSASYARAENMERMLGDFSRERQPSDPITDGNFAFEEDFVPSSLQELLTPQERNRRMSRTDDEGVSNIRHSLTGTPGDIIGSPPVGSPSSGWGPIVMRGRRDEDHAPLSSLGHVGSPLRNSFQHAEPSPTFRALNRTVSGDISPFPGSPTRANPTVSVLSQHFQRTRLSSRSDSYGSGEVPAVSKGLTAPNGKQMERAVSSSHSSNGKAVEPIDEEPEPETQFIMEEEEPANRSSGATGNSSGLGLEATETWNGYPSSNGKSFR